MKSNISFLKTIILAKILISAGITQAKILPGNFPKNFATLLSDLDRDDLKKISVGQSLFAKPWVQAPSSTIIRDGLGPHFNATSCMSCHHAYGRGAPPKVLHLNDPALLIRLSLIKNKEKNIFIDDPVYGGQLSPHANINQISEGKVTIEYQELINHYPDGKKVILLKPIYHFEKLNYGQFSSKTLFSPRIAPHLAGLGLLELIPTGQILKNEDIKDQDHNGISGKANWVFNKKENRLSLGRFGWKANQPSLLQQNAAAFRGDMGITNSLFPEESCTKSQQKCLMALNGGTPEISDLHLGYVTKLIQSIAPPKRVLSKKKSIIGKSLFKKIGCTSCHLESFTLPNKLKISPYTDLLLHDMGEALADHRPDLLATGNEWKTPPLWGIGSMKKVNRHTRLLHDGRARNIEEAIIWHGGEAKQTKEKFMHLSLKERKEVLKFLHSL